MRWPREIALPTVSGDEAHKKAMYASTFEVLHPQISRVKALIAFKERAKSVWLSNLALLVRAESKSKGSKGDVPVPCEAGGLGHCVQFQACCPCRFGFG